MNQTSPSPLNADGRIEVNASNRPSLREGADISRSGARRELYFKPDWESS